MGQRRVSVVVADDHPLFREAIERAVRQRPELELVVTSAAGHGTTVRASLPLVAAGGRSEP